MVSTDEYAGVAPPEKPAAAANGRPPPAAKSGVANGKAAAAAAKGTPQESVSAAPGEARRKGASLDGGAAGSDSQKESKAAAKKVLALLRSLHQCGLRPVHLCRCAASGIGGIWVSPMSANRVLRPLWRRASCARRR